MKKLNLPKKIFKSEYLLMFMLFAMKHAYAQPQTKPVYYWTCEGSNPLKDSMNNSNLNPTTFKCIYTVTPPSTGSVGNSLSLDSAGRTIVCTNNFIMNSVVSIEFLFKPGADFNTTTFIHRRDNAFSVKFGYPFIEFLTTNSAGSDNFHINLRGVGCATYGYYTDGNWHHMVFKYNTITGIKQIWVDGQLPQGFSDTTATGTFAGGVNAVDLNANTSYIKYYGNIDEIALYDQDLPANNIYKHYIDFTMGNHYSFPNSSVAPPAPAPVTGPVDINEYAPGHPNYTMDAPTQLQNFPVPRYKKGHTLLPNFNWLGIKFFSGDGQPMFTPAQKIANSVTIQTELVKNFNYYLTVSCNVSSKWSDYANPAKYEGAWVALANQHPQWQTSAIIFWAQLNPQLIGYTQSKSYIHCKTFPNNYYIRNASGQFLSRDGSVDTASRVISPAAPLDSFTIDGLTQKFYLTKLLNALTRPLNIINENDEVITHYTNNALAQDPLVLADKATSGFTDWEDYKANRKKRMCTNYRDQFMTMPALQNTKYAEYQVGGRTDAYLKYSQTRFINKPINGQIYPTPDFYPRWPSNWRNWNAAWNGWQSIADGRVNELAVGDKLFSPYVAAGWNKNEESNIRPAQWLGLLKALGMAGAEFYYAGFFNDDPYYNSTNFPANPAGYAWQAVMPSYAQAITSRYENLLRNGDLMNGDVPNSYANPTTQGYSFETGDLRKLVVIRKDHTQNIYAITGTIQPNSNMLGNTELQSDAKIKLDGNPLQFTVRRQGSTYIYNNTNPASPVFYQLDGWHENSHPCYWTKDFNIESELFDNTTAFKIKTDRAPGAAITDFRNSVSYISLPTTANTATADYYIQPRTSNNYYFWVRARSHNGAAATITVALDSITKTIGCITDTNWQWYSIDGCSQQRIAYMNLSAAEHKLSLTATGAGIEIDRVLMTLNSTLNLNNNQPVCSTSLATVSPSGPTTFCQGSNVTLTANGSGTYQWSNGATSKSITVSTAGNYSVTIIGGTCNSISAPVTVTVKSKPSATITSGGSTTICPNDSVMLTASAASSYTWSNGVTTQSIYASTAGNYNVTVTGTNGCTKTSAAEVVVVAQVSPATITASGSTNICPGESVTLTSAPASTYLWSTGETTQSVTAATTNSYSVTAYNASGCSSISAATNVTVAPAATATITTTGSTQLIQGQSVVLTANNGSSYLWLPNGETTSSITVTQSGNYQVTVYNTNGCSATSSIVSVNVMSLSINISTSGLTSICSGDSTVLTAPPYMTSYIWTPNGETTQSITVSQSGIYGVTVTDTLGNTASDSETISVIPVPAAPSISISYIPNVAYQLTASAPSASSFLWSNGETTSTITIITPAIYSVQAINSIGCASPWSTMNVNSITGQACAKADMLTVFNVTDTSVTLGWNPAVTGDSFVITYWENGTTNYQTLTVNGNLSTQLISGLQPGVTYNWIIQTNCLNSQQLSDPASFSTLINALPCGSIPQNLSTTNINTNTANLNWYPTIATQFRVRIRPVGVGTYATRTFNGVTNMSGGGLSNLAPNTTYEWSILSVCNGVTSAFSAPSYFTTLDTCGYMGILEVNNITSNRAILMWDNLSTMDTVRIRITDNAINYKRNIYLSQNPVNGVYQLTGLKPNRSYSAEVRGKCSTGQLGIWSNKITFTTEDIVLRSESGNLGLNGFPNPTATTLNYSFADVTSSDYTLKVCDMAGREMYQEVRYAEAGPNTGEVDVRQYATGLYMLIVQKGAQASRFRFAVH